MDGHERHTIGLICHTNGLTSSLRDLCMVEQFVQDAENSSMNAWQNCDDKKTRGMMLKSDKELGIYQVR